VKLQIQGDRRVDSEVQSQTEAVSIKGKVDERQGEGNRQKKRASLRENLREGISVEIKGKRTKKKVGCAGKKWEKKEVCALMHKNIQSPPGEWEGDRDFQKKNSS